MALVNSFTTRGLCGEIRLPGHRRQLLNQIMSPSNRSVRLPRIPARCTVRVHPRVQRCVAWGFAAPDSDCATLFPSKRRSCLQVKLQTCFHLHRRFLWSRQRWVVWQIADENASRDAVFFCYLGRWKIMYLWCLKNAYLVLGSPGGPLQTVREVYTQGCKPRNTGFATEIAS
jgi:hypothetical protein